MIIRLIVVLAMFPLLLSAQKYTTYDNCHSHNDYLRKRPFYEAFEACFGSIEADIFLLEGELYVAHDSADIRSDRTLRGMYLEPIKREMERNGGSCYPNGRSVQLLIDLKTDFHSTLPVLERLLLEYKECFDIELNPTAVRVVVSGSMPSSDQFKKYSAVVIFDGRSGVVYDDEQIGRVAMISASFGDFSHWNGKGCLPIDDRQRIKEYVDAGHAQGLKVRFWGCPDTQDTWRCFMDMGIDFINTDRPYELACFIDKL